MQFIQTTIPDVFVVEPQVFGDDRGFFLEYWHQRKYRDHGIDVNFVQDNHSRSIRHTLRGLHYQIQHAQGKLVKVILGEIFDVAVDLRRSSQTFGQWTGEHLSADNKKMLWVPEGFAHGFLVVSETAEVCYKCTDYYSPEHERSLLWNDPDVGIEWPIAPDQIPILSEKDANAVKLIQAETFA